MDGGTYDLSGTKFMTVHPENTRSIASMLPRYTFHPEHIRSLASMLPRYTFHPEHKKVWSKPYSLNVNF